MAPSNDKKPLAEVAREKLASNPSALGDPVSLKAETSPREPVPSSTSAASPGGSASGSKNPTMLGDPTSLKAETSSTNPTAEERGAGAANSNKPSGDGLTDAARRTNPSLLGDPVSLKAEKSRNSKL